ncbi:glycosyl hydrolase [Streptomyces sp. H39-S7]|uniref:glycosyl hydrolase n=1 Tax=Streptomyces sp. H39-S7 TaxID=3004357 RepID=UPI0022AF96BA|nr:glycosyl hydrolase [Streptomyces sp. H39-S7]
MSGALALSAAAIQQPAHAQAADPPATQAYQAEDGVLNGVAVGTSVPGFQGTGYVEGFDQAGDSVTITVPDHPGGLYTLSVHYAGPYGDKKANLLVNDAGVGEISLPGTDGFSDVAAGNVLLKSGANTVTISNDWGWYLIDSISLAPAPPRPPHAATGELSDPQATPEATSMAKYLAANYGKGILSGQQDAAHEQWLENATGKAPAIEGLDLMDYSPSRVERGTVGHDTDNALAWDARGGMVSLCWHWNAPSGLIDQPGKEWWRGFYTDATTFDVAAALADPSGADYQLLLRDIDAIAVQLRRLQDAGVPVLWRPLHEAEGGWFWWGAKGPGPAKALYRLMHERLTTVDGIHNLIWVWNSVDPDWYPGADVVDLVSADSYPTAGDHGPVAVTYDRELSLTGDTKVAALSEVGTIPDPDLLRAYQADWSYFVAWGGSEQDGTSNSLDFLQRVYDDPYVITLDELGDFKHTGGGGSDTRAPAAPTGLTGTATSSTVHLSWTASIDNVGVTGYDVYRDGTRVGGTTSDTTYLDTGLTAATAYGYTIKAHDAAGNLSTASAPFGVTTASTTGPGDEGCTATYATTNSWGSGFTADVTVRAGTKAITSWTVTWTYAGNQKITSAWNGTVVQSGASVTAGNMPYNGSLSAGDSRSFGFLGTFSGTSTPPTLLCTAN